MRPLIAAVAAGLVLTVSVSSATPAFTLPARGPSPNPPAPPPQSRATIDPDQAQAPDIVLNALVSERPDQVNIGAASTRTTPGQPGHSETHPASGPGAPRRQCRLASFPSTGAPGGQDLAGFPALMTTKELAGRLPATLVPGQLYARYCTDDGENWVLTGGVVFQPGDPAAPGAPPVPVVSPRVLAEEALAGVHVPAPRVGTAPPYRNDTLVGIDTWLWVDPAQWHELTATARVAGLSVTATVKPARVTWDMGEGHNTKPTVCHSAGTVYNRHLADDLQHTQCFYDFQWASWDHRSDLPGADLDDLYHAQATVSWQVNWVASDGEFGSLADLSSATAFDLRVEDLQAVVCENTPLGGCHPPPATARH